MADNIGYWFNELTKESDNFSALLEKLKTLVASTNTQAIERCARDCEIKSNRIKEVRKSFGLELKIIKNKEEKQIYEGRAREIDEKFADLSTQFTQTKSQITKKDLLGESQASKNIYSTEGKNNDTLLDEANKIQDLTFESLARTKNLIDASKEIGKETVGQLQAQRQQIIDIEIEVDALDSNIVRAEKLVLNFSRRMATDRIIQIFFAINVVIMLGLILYVAISGRSLTMKNSVSNNKNNAPVVASSYSPSLFPTTFGSRIQNKGKATVIRNKQKQTLRAAPGLGVV